MLIITQYMFPLYFTLPLPFPFSPLMYYVFSDVKLRTQLGQLIYLFHIGIPPVKIGGEEAGQGKSILSVAASF